MHKTPIAEGDMKVRIDRLKVICCAGINKRKASGGHELLGSQTTGEKGRRKDDVLVEMRPKVRRLVIKREEVTRFRLFYPKNNRVFDDGNSSWDRNINKASGGLGNRLKGK